MITVRPEKGEDKPLITRITKAAFEDHPYSHQTEHLMVNQMRDSDGLALSLMAEIDGIIVGHIAFSKVFIDGKDLGWYAVGPLSVDPEYQRKGVGSALVHDGLSKMRESDAKGIVLVGDPAYYKRFGFRQGTTLTFHEVPAENFLVLPLKLDEPEGEVSFHAAFSE